MSSRGKKKTTMAKLTRESRLRQRRVDKAMKKDARRNAPPADEVSEPLDGEAIEPLDGEAIEGVREDEPATVSVPASDTLG
jgi:hypothetical protein